MFQDTATPLHMVISELEKLLPTDYHFPVVYAHKLTYIFQDRTYREVQVRLSHAGMTIVDRGVGRWEFPQQVDEALSAVDRLRRLRFTRVVGADDQLRGRVSQHLSVRAEEARAEVTLSTLFEILPMASQRPLTRQHGLAHEFVDTVGRTHTVIISNVAFKVTRTDLPPVHLRWASTTSSAKAEEYLAWLGRRARFVRTVSTDGPAV